MRGILHSRDFDRVRATCYDSRMRRIKAGDVAILLASLVIITLSLTALGTFAGKPEIHVEASGKRWVYDLSVDATATFEGPVGKTSIEIKDERVHVHDSDCRNKVFIAAGWISRPGQWIICLHNDVFILIEGTKEEGETDDTAF